VSTKQEIVESILDVIPNRISGRKFEVQMWRTIHAGLNVADTKKEALGLIWQQQSIWRVE